MQSSSSNFYQADRQPNHVRDDVYLKSIFVIMRILFLITFAFLSISDLSGQISYSGFIDKYPIELVTDIYADDARAIYC